MIARRALLRGLFAMPAIVAAGSLMPIRGTRLVMPWEGVSVLDGSYLARWYYLGYDEYGSPKIEILENLDGPNFGKWQSRVSGHIVWDEQ